MPGNGQFVRSEQGCTVRQLGWMGQLGGLSLAFSAPNVNPGLVKIWEIERGACISVGSDVVQFAVNG